MRNIVTFVLATAVAGPVFAEMELPMPPGTYAYGDLGLGYYSGDGYDYKFAYTEMRLGFDSRGAAASAAAELGSVGSLGSLGSIGSGLGGLWYGVAADVTGIYDLGGDDDATHRVLPWAYIGGGFGKVSLGYTPTIADDYLTENRIASGFIQNRYFVGPEFGSPLSAYRRYYGDEVLSLRYDVALNGLGLGAAYSRLDGDIGAVSLGVRYETPQFGPIVTAAAAYESVQDDGPSYLGASLSADFGNWDASLRYSDTEYQSSYSIGGNFDISSKLSIGANYAHVSDYDFDVSTLYAGYSFTPAIKAELGANRYASPGDSTTEYYLGLNYNFDFGSRPRGVASNFTY